MIPNCNLSITNPEIYAEELNRNLQVNTNLMKFLGLWYMNGHIINNNSCVEGIYITINSNNENLIEF